MMCIVLSAMATFALGSFVRPCLRSEMAPIEAPVARAMAVNDHPRPSSSRTIVCHVFMAAESMASHS